MNDTKNKLFSRRFVNNAIMIGIVFAAGMVTIVYIKISRDFWNQYHTDYLSQGERITNTLNQMKQKATNSTAARDNAVQALSSLSNSEYSCKSNILIDWQRQFIKKYKEWHDECRVISDRSKGIKTKLEPVVGYLRNEHDLASILSRTMVNSSEIKDTDFESVLKSWTEALSAIDSIRSVAEFKSVQDAARLAVNKIIDSWRELIDANTARDAVRYKKAVASLDEAYGAMSKIVDLSRQEFDKLTR